MALTHVVDTSVLTRLRDPAVAERIIELATTGRLARCSISDLELGYSARSAEEHDRITASLSVFDVAAIDESHVTRAGQVQRQLAAASQRGRKVPDLLIAAVAEELDVTLVHYDSDFDLIAEVTGQPTKWIVAAGSVD